MSYSLVDALGGPSEFKAIIADFYDRIYDDVMIGFFFLPHDKTKLIDSQMAYLSSVLGNRSGTYSGPSIRAAHKPMPILVGHFDRRHEILKSVLLDYDVPEIVQQEWLTLDLALRDQIIRIGGERRDELNNDT